jgi:sugar/nucleoside kinase (ribokinase family)
MADLAVLGHVVIDEVIDAGGERTQLGGPPTYVSLAARKLRKSVKAVTKVGGDFPQEYISQLLELGVELEGMIVDGAETTRFVLDYRGTERRLSVRSICVEIEPGDVSELPEVVLINPVAGEVPPSVVSLIRADLMALDPQGYVRDIGEDGRVLPKRWFDGALLRRLDVFKASEEELSLVTGEANPLWGMDKLVTLGIAVVIATRGNEGALLAAGRRRFSIPACEVRDPLDATGAGDVFMGGFLSEHLDGEEPLWCASMGAAMASCVVETLGPRIDASRGKVRRRADDVYNRIKEL